MGNPTTMAVGHIHLAGSRNFGYVLDTFQNIQHRGALALSTKPSRASRRVKRSHPAGRPQGGEGRSGRQISPEQSQRGFRQNKASRELGETNLVPFWPNELRSVLAKRTRTVPWPNELQVPRLRRPAPRGVRQESRGRTWHASFWYTTLPLNAAPDYQ